MNFVRLLQEKREVILEKWLHCISDTYPSETANLLKKKNNPFICHMGSSIREDIESIYDRLLNDEDAQNASSSLDNIIRIRAVQEFAPSEAMSFMFLLKDAIKDEMKSEIRENGLSKELFSFESRIDKYALKGFDIYMQCREKIYELKANEVKARAYTLLKRANMICETKES
jgi:hypothetical protein